MTFYNALNVVSAICHWRAAQAIGFSSEADDLKVGAESEKAFRWFKQVCHLNTSFPYLNKVGLHSVIFKSGQTLILVFPWIVDSAKAAKGIIY